MPLERRIWLKSLLAGSALSLTYSSLLAQDKFDANLAGRNADQHLTKLEDQLKFGLRTTTPEQFQYVQTISQLVDNGTLPRAMVNLVYKWSLERNPRVPFPYFQFALRELARRRGITLP